MRKIIAQELRRIAARLEDDAHPCEITQEDASEILASVTNVSLSQSEAASYLNMNERKFRYKVETGEIPPGKKRKGITEKLWSLRELRKLFAR